MHSEQYEIWGRSWEERHKTLKTRTAKKIDEPFGFMKAVELMKKGVSVYRANGFLDNTIRAVRLNGMFFESIHHNDTLAFWTSNQEDVLAMDWRVFHGV